MAEPVQPVDELRAADRRVPGRRGRATRRRLLESTDEHLRSTPYRALKVVDIARAAGTSPATFYQYFADVDAAVLALAREAALDGQRLVRRVADGSWRGRAGFQAALDLTDAFLAFWDAHRPVLRVVDAGSDEGDRRFHAVRVRLLDALTAELARVIGAVQAHGRNLGVDPLAQAAVVVTTLAGVAAHLFALELWGVRPAEARLAVARQVYAGTTGQRPPS
ncbi:MAG TPA: TetR family transcriptional regulator [Acidimicrobiales bacterium]|nr:TetR family transcriptional regulator [Acidimicrobiales bacterium]